MTHRTDRPLDNPINWSFRVGRVFGIDVRMHVAFIIAASVMIYFEYPRESSTAPWSLSGTVFRGLGTYILLFSIVLLHEFGHCFGARYTGGEANEILIWPLGGLAFTKPPHNPAAHMITTLAGPMVNVIICAATSFTLVLWTQSLEAVPWNPLHPLTPLDPTMHLTTGQEIVLRTFGVSYALLLFNMLPIFPLDGGRFVQAWMWPKRGYRDATALASGVGMVGAIVVFVIGLFTEQKSLFLIIAAVGYYDCWRTRRSLYEHGSFDTDEFGYDFSRGYLAFDEQEECEKQQPGMMERWRRRRAAEKARKELERQVAHDQAVEEILAKVFQSGINSLTSRERRVLEEETRKRREKDEARE